MLEAPARHGKAKSVRMIELAIGAGWSSERNRALRFRLVKHEQAKSVRRIESPSAQIGCSGRNRALRFRLVKRERRATAGRDRYGAHDCRTARRELGFRAKA